MRPPVQNVPMCVVALAWNTHPRWRLLLAGNRDEFHPRPAAPLAAWTEIPGLLAGRDLQSGGTWTGVDARGRCAVVTNVRDPLAPPSARPTRGRLPLAFLADTATPAETAARLLPQADQYAPFNLLMADADHCHYLGNHPAIETRAVPAGIHGMSNGGFDTPWPKTRRLCTALQDWLQGPADDPDALWQALADDTPATDAELPDTGVGPELERRLSPVFIHGREYGTRACTLIAIGHDGTGWIRERRFGPDGVFEGETALPIPSSQDSETPCGAEESGGAGR